MNLERVIARLVEVIGPGLEAQVAERLIAHIQANPRTTIHITPRFAGQIAQVGTQNDASVVRALQYLAGDGIGILEMRFELFDDDADEVHDLTDAEAKVALESHVNPRTGDYDEAIESKVGIYFSPRREAFESTAP